MEYIAISSPVNDQQLLLDGLEILKSWGLNYSNKVKTGRHWGYLSVKD